MPSPAAPSRLPLAALLAIVLLGAAMRLWQARESLWLDELHTAWCAIGSLAEVAPRATMGNQSPLFFWLHWLLVQVIGPSELTLRLPSLVAGSLLPVALYCLIRRWTSETWLAVLAAWLVVVDPKQIFYATEARPYALVELLAVLHVAVLVELLDRPTLWLRLAWVLGAGLLFHLHYTAALLLASEVFAIAIAIRTDEDRIAYRRRDLALDLLLIALLTTPALGNLRAIYGRRQNWEAFVDPQPIWAIFTLLPWTRTALVLPIAQAFCWYRSRATSDNRPAVIACSWLFVPLVLAWIATSTDVARIFLLRYLVVSAPAAILLTVLGLRLILWRRVQFAVGLTIAVLAITLSPITRQFATDGRFIADRHGDWRSAIAHFNRQPDHDRDPVLLATQLIEADSLRGSPDSALAAYCLFPVHSLYLIDADPAITIPLPRTNPGELDPQVRELVRSRCAAWLIVGGSAATVDAITQAMQASLEEGSAFRVQGSGDDDLQEGSQKSVVSGRESEWQAAQRHSFGTVHVLRFEALDRNP